MEDILNRLKERRSRREKSGSDPTSSKASGDFLLDKYITKLNGEIEEKTVKGIKYPKLLLQTLMRLRLMVGLQRIKKEVVVQTVSLIKKKQKDPFSMASGSNMLNMALYGPPGVGKTEIGIILSRIWYSLGYLEDAKSEGGKLSWKDSLLNMLSDEKNLISIGVMIMVFEIFCTNYGKYGAKKTFEMFLVFFLVCLAIYYLVSSFSQKQKKNSGKNSGMGPGSGGKPGPEEEDELDLVHDPIRIVSREDLVSVYIGGTANKTLDLLKSVQGKEVLFIDEAYSLIHGQSDSYGMEALTTLNNYMSLHPNEIIVIFAGYKKLMEKGIFTSQPGLKSRCMYHWDCEGYTGDELFQIFIRKILIGGKYTVEGDSRIYLLFESQAEIFYAYGRDVDRLIYYCEMIINEEEFDLDNFEKEKEMAKKVLNFELIEKGFNQLKLNNKPPAKKKKNKMKEMFRSGLL